MDPPRLNTGILGHLSASASPRISATMDYTHTPTVTLIPEHLWTPTYLLANLSILEAASQQNPIRVGEVFSTPASTSAPASASRLSTKVKNPEYDGNPQELRTFITQLRNKLSINQDHFSSEEAQVAFAYQCLTSSAAGSMRAHFLHLENPAVQPEIYTIEDFIEKLKYYFQDLGLLERSN